jgi:hypothetical protein
MNRVLGLASFDEPFQVLADPFCRGRLIRYRHWFWIVRRSHDTPSEDRGPLPRPPN